MKTAVCIAGVQSRVVLARAVSSKTSISGIPKALRGGSQRFAVGRLACIDNHQRVPSIVLATGTDLHQGVAVSSSRQEEGQCGSDQGDWMRVVSGGFEEARCPQAEDHVKDQVRDEDGSNLLLGAQGDVAWNVDQRVSETLTNGLASDNIGFLTGSGLPSSKDRRVEDLSQVAQSLSCSLLSTLEQQRALLSQWEARNGSDGDNEAADVEKNPSKRTGDLVSVLTTGTTVGIEEVSFKEKAVRFRRRMECRTSAQNSKAKRSLNGSVSRQRSIVKAGDEGTYASIIEGEDEKFMAEALGEARKAALAGEVPVGAVIVQKGKIIARAYNRVEEEGDPTAHAEMLCIRHAAKSHGDWRLMDATLYVTLEPCAMCAGAILQSRVKGVVWGARNTLLGADGSWVSLFPELVEKESGGDSLNSEREISTHRFHTSLQVRRGVLGGDCSAIMQTFFQARRKGKVPPVRKKPLWLPLSAWVLFKRLVHFWSLFVQL